MLVSPFGRMVVFGAKNINDTLLPEQMRQLVVGNQTMVGFNIPTMPKEMIAPLVPALLDLIASRKIRIFAAHRFPLTQVTAAFEALASRRTVGKVVLTP